MAAPELAQLGLDQALGADAQPGDAGRAEAREVAAILRSRVGFERDLGSVLDAQPPIDVVEKRATSSAGSSDGVPPPR